MDAPEALTEHERAGLQLWVDGFGSGLASALATSAAREIGSTDLPLVVRVAIDDLARRRACQTVDNPVVREQVLAVARARFAGEAPPKSSGFVVGGGDGK